VVRPDEAREVLDANIKDLSHGCDAVVCVDELANRTAELDPAAR
jgi:hypothetical protein